MSALRSCNLQLFQGYHSLRVQALPAAGKRWERSKCFCKTHQGLTACINLTHHGVGRAQQLALGLKCAMVSFLNMHTYTRGFPGARQIQ
eukprot:203795-Amphidinium_carterae.1